MTTREVVGGTQPITSLIVKIVRIKFCIFCKKMAAITKFALNLKINQEFNQLIIQSLIQSLLES